MRQDSTYEYSEYYEQIVLKMCFKENRNLKKMLITRKRQWKSKAHILRKEYLGNLTLTGKRSKGKHEVKYQ